MYNRRYEKVFLMLRQETAGYALGKRPPWGSCVMEIKNGQGRLQLTVQGLRRGVYGVYVMLGENPAETLFCGELRPTGKEGQGELKWDFSPDALGHGKKAEDFQTVVLLAEEGKSGAVSAPLTAFFGKKKDWKREFQPNRPVKEPEKADEIHLQAAEAAVLPMRPRAEAARKAEIAKKTEKTEKTEPTAKQPEEPKTNKPESLSHKIAEEQKADGCHGNFSGLLAKFRQELQELEETGVLTPEETARIRNIGDTEGEREQTAAESAKQESQLESVPLEFEKNKELQPFGDGVSWKCLALEELTLLAKVPLKWQKEFFFLLPYRRYRHLILRAEGGCLWLGLPCVYRAEDAKEAESFGFKEFRYVDDARGYWLARLEREDVPGEKA